MSEYIFTLISNVFTGVLSYYLGKRSQRSKTQLEMIMELYRPLIADLRNSRDQCIKNFYDAYGFIDRDKWVLLDKYFNDGTIRAIEGYDKILYDHLFKLKNEVIPLVNSFEKRRRDIIEVIKTDWVEFLFETATTFEKLDFANQISIGVIWVIWRGEYDEAYKLYKEFVENKLKERLYLDTPPEESTFDNLWGIATSYMDVIKEEFKEVEELFKNLIAKDIIPRMESTIKDKFK